jgi:TadE-like protein
MTESRFRRWTGAFLADTSGSQILEFAVALPLLVVFVVGIFDFGEAFNTKQKLSNIAREAARFGSTLPTNDMDTAGSISVQAIRDLIVSDLQAARLNDCGLIAAPVIANLPNLTWTYNATGGGCVAPFVLTIERGYSFPTPPVGGFIFNVISTRVTLQYPYPWRFNRVIGLMSAGATYPGVSILTTDATMPNME